jgi:hypothetical protein
LTTYLPEEIYTGTTSCYVLDNSVICANQATPKPIKGATNKWTAKAKYKTTWAQFDKNMVGRKLNNLKQFFNSGKKRLTITV